MTDYNAGRRFIKSRRADLVGALPNRSKNIRGVFLHSTRSGRCGNPLEGVGTENWMNNPNNTGAAYDGLIYPDGAQVKAMRWEADEQPLWCAGYGDAATWNAQLYYVHLEVTQGCITDPFAPEQVESTAQWTAEIMRPLGVPVERIPFLWQTGVAPAGVASHDASANGEKLGKSDPGPMWPWVEYIKRVNALLSGEEAATGMSDDELLAVWSGKEEAQLSREERLRNARWRRDEAAAGRAPSVAEMAAAVGAHKHVSGEVIR